MVGDRLHAREQAVEVRRDHLLERDEPLAVGQPEEAGQQGRHLHPGEAFLAGRRVAHHDREVQREVRDVGERVGRVDRQRREHREDPLVEDAAEVLTVRLGQCRPVGEPDADLVERGCDLAVEERGQTLHHRLDPGTDRAQLLPGVEPIG